MTRILEIFVRFRDRKRETCLLYEHSSLHGCIPGLVVYRTLQVLMRSGGSILDPFYHKDAFIRKQEDIDGFLRQLRGLRNVDILVDTMTVLSHPPLLYLYEMEGKRKMNEAATAGFFPATTALATKSANPSGRDGKGINVGVITRGRLQSKLMTKMQEQRKNGLGNKE